MWRSRSTAACCTWPTAPRRQRVALFSDNDPDFFTRIRNGKPGAGTGTVHRPCPTQFCQTWHGAWSECIQGGDRRMCCLPTLEQVLDAAAAFLRDTPQS